MATLVLAQTIMNDKPDTAVWATYWAQNCFDDDVDFSESCTGPSTIPSDSHMKLTLQVPACIHVILCKHCMKTDPRKVHTYIPSGTVEYRQWNMAPFSTVALHTFSMDQVYSCGIMYSMWQNVEEEAGNEDGHTSIPPCPNTCMASGSISNFFNQVYTNVIKVWQSKFTFHKQKLHCTNFLSMLFMV